MINKDLLKYIGEKKKLIFIIVFFNVINLFLNLLTTGSFILSIYYLINDTLNKGLIILLVALIFIFIKIFTTKIASKKANDLADFVTYKLRNETYTKFLNINGNSIFTTSEMAQLSTEGIEQLRLYYSVYLPSFFYAMIAPIILFIIFMLFDYKVALLYLCCVPLIPMSIIAVSKWAKKIFAKYWDQYISLGNSFLDNTQGMKELKIFKYDEQKQQIMDGEAENFRKITMKVLTMQLASVTIMDLVAFGGAGIGIVLSLIAMKNGLNIYITIFMILIGAEFFLPLRSLGSAFHVAMNGATAGNKIMKLLEVKNNQNGDKKLETIKNVNLQNVNFKIDNKEILKNINLELKPGFYSLVGLSGSGKSTIAKLLSKIYANYTGSITINDVDINEYDNKSFYNKIAYVGASTYLFHQSIRDLFKFYNHDISDEKILELLSSVNLSHLPLDYMINDESSNISGGEKQRLTLALYLTKEYDFYIFDEITSNIDIESEEIILNIIKKLSETKIVLNISHRLKSTQYADHIYYLDQGIILLEGNYHELNSYDNKFKQLFDIQQEMEVVK